jgi:multicomponent K+:H+ antiporter subunit D
MAGMPPLSGFIGKLLVLDAARSDNWAVTIWATILVSSLIMIVGLARAGSLLFWKSHDETVVLPLVADDAGTARAEPEPEPERPNSLPFVAVFALLGMLVLLTVFAGPVTDYTSATVGQLFDPAGYIDAVMKRP